MIDIKTGKAMTRGGFLKGILASGIAPSITLATLANARSANASVGGMMRNVGARNAAMFGGGKTGKSQYPNQYDNGWWDAEWNVGDCQNDKTSLLWKDLTGSGNDFTIPNANLWGDKALSNANVDIASSRKLPYSRTITFVIEVTRKSTYAQFIRFNNLLGINQIFYWQSSISGVQFNEGGNGWNNSDKTLTFIGKYEITAVFASAFHPAEAVYYNGQPLVSTGRSDSWGQGSGLIALVKDGGNAATYKISMLGASSIPFTQEMVLENYYVNKLRFGLT